MQQLKDISQHLPIKKIAEVIKNATSCLFTSGLTKRPVPTRPLSAAEVDEEGNIWFFSNASNDKTKQQGHDQHVQLSYSNDALSEYLTIYGDAEIITGEQAAKHRLSRSLDRSASSAAGAGPTLFKLHPKKSFYWNTQDGKMISDNHGH